MSLKLTTDRELDELEEKRYLTFSQTDALNQLIYRDTKYRSHFPFAYIDKTVDERFVGYAGAICNQDYEDESFDEPFPKDVDIYICANGMKSPYKRDLDNLINIQNLVIDIDYHESELSIDELNEHIEKFEKQLIKKLIVKPNLINRTGRGIHLWYFIEPCHVSLSKICQSVIDMMCIHIDEILQELNETVLKTDKSASLKLNGLFRLPYTYNTKAKRWSECSLLHESLQDINIFRKKLLKKGYHSDYFVELPKKSKKKKQQNKTFPIKYHVSLEPDEKRYIPCLIHRKHFMEYLFQTRDVKEGARNAMIFAMYITLIKLHDTEEAREYCRNINDTFDKPLKSCELNALFKCADKNRYNYTVEKFLDLINATKEEKAYYHKLNLKKQRQKERQENKEQRNRKVKELYEEGYTIVAISKELTLSRPTIYKILKSE